jgi:hypothetical protein
MLRVFRSLIFVICVCVSSVAVFLSPSAAGPIKEFFDPHRKVITVSPKNNLGKTVSSAGPGTTILLKAGIYRISSTLVFRRSDVWIRSESGDRNRVILDGKKPGKRLSRGNCVNEIFAVLAPNICIANLTARYARDHIIHIFPPRRNPIKNIRMHNIHVYDSGQQLIKVNSNGSKPLYWVDDCILENSLLEFKDSSIMQKTGNSFYTGGLDVHGGMNWQIRNNTFNNIQRKGKLMEHAVHMWSKSRGTIVERNRFINCYRAIGFGMKTRANGLVRRYPDQKGDKPYFDHIGGIIRNNFIFNKKGIHLESGIELMNVIDVEVLNNTVVSHDRPFASIEYRWPNTRVAIQNNIVSHNIRARDNARAKLKRNILSANRHLFRNYGKGDLHLSPNRKEAIDKGTPFSGGKVTVDIDGDRRDRKPDIGADELDHK